MPICGPFTEPCHNSKHNSSATSNEISIGSFDHIERVAALEKFQEMHTESHVEELRKATRDEDSKKLTRLEDSMQTIHLYLRELHTQTQRLEDAKGV